MGCICNSVLETTMNGAMDYGASESSHGIAGGMEPSLEVDVEVPADEDDSEAESSEMSFIEGKEVEEDGNLPGCFLQAQAIGLMPMIDQMQISVVGGLVLIRYLYKGSNLYIHVGWPLYRRYGHAFEAFKLILADPDTNPSLHRSSR
ncbi:hypothetical protein C5167_028165 [Papaver somniferum]|nr:hypothetical protein C5167_028165 [Papaver somniferum]